MDALVGEGVADPARLAVSGYSYGGFMAAWTTSHTDRFKAAIVGAPIVNAESFYGTSDIGRVVRFREEAGGDLVGHRELFRRLSPIQYVERVTTPTLVVHGEADDRCPIGQGEEWYIGLLAAGRAPAEFVRLSRPEPRVSRHRPSEPPNRCRSANVGLGGAASSQTSLTPRSPRRPPVPPPLVIHGRRGLLSVRTHRD